MQLVCDEQAIHQQGTDTRRAICRVYRAILFSQRKFEITPQQAFEAAFDIAVPDAAMHSFVSPHNAVMWAIVVRGRMARWGDFERRFPIYVYPTAVESKLDIARRSISTTGAVKYSMTTPGIRITFRFADRPVPARRPAQRPVHGRRHAAPAVRGRPSSRCCGTPPAKAKKTWPSTISSDWSTIRRSRSICACRTALPRVAAQPAELRRRDREGLLVRPRASVPFARTGNVKRSAISLGKVPPGQIEQPIAD